MTAASVSEPQLLTRLASGELTGDWTLNKNRSSATLRTRSMWGLARVNGTFNQLSGAASVSRDGLVMGTLVIAADSIDTKNTKRDTHLRSADFLYTERHPSLVYRLHKVTADNQGLTADGTLTVRDTSRSVSVSLHGVALSETQIELTATIVIDRSEFGMTWNQMGMASSKNDISISAIFDRM